MSQATGAFAVPGTRDLTSPSFGPFLAWVVGLHFSAHVVTRKFFWNPEGVPLLALSDGVLLAALLLSRPGRWPFLFLATLGSAILAGFAVAESGDLAGVLASPLVGGAGAVFAAALVRRFLPPPPDPTLPRELATTILLAAGVAGSLTAAVGASLSSSGFIGSTWLLAWRGEALAVGGVVPTILLWTRTPDRPLRRSVVETTIILLLSSGLAAVVSFLPTWPAAGTVLAGLPLILWGAVRSGPACAMTSSLLLAAGVAGTAPIASAEILLAGLLATVVVGEWERREARSGRRLSLGHLISEVTSGLVGIRGPDVDREIRHCLARLGEHLGADTAFVLQLSPDGSRFSVTHEWARLGRGVEIARKSLHDAPTERFATLWERVGEDLTVSFRDPADLPPSASELREYCRAMGIRSHLSLPMISQGEVLGLVGFETLDRERDWTEEVIRQLKIVGVILANTLHRQRSDAQHHRLENVLEAATDFVGVADLEGRLLYLNRTARDWMGVSADTDVGTLTVWDSHPRAEAERLFREAVPVALREGFWHGESTFYRGGSEIPTSQVIVAHASPGGGIQFLSTIARDVTRQKRTEEALRESEALYRTLVEFAAEAIFIYDVDQDRFVEANENATRVFGYEREKFLELSPIDISPARQPDGKLSRTVIQERLEETLEGGVPVFEKTYLKANGELFPAEVRLVRVPLARRLIRISLADITERRRSADAVQRHARRLDEAQRIAQVGNFEWDVATGDFYCSEELRRIFRLHEESANARHELIRHVHPEDRRDVRRRLRLAVTRGLPYALDHRILLPGGEVRFVHGEGELEKDATGRPTRLIGTVQDVTERKRADEEAERHRQELIEADKMIALGTLVSGVAHEINNPNHVITLNTPILRDAWRDLFPILERHWEKHPGLRLANIPYEEMREEIPNLIHEMHRGADRIKHIVSELRSFARRETPDLEEGTSVNDAVRSALTLLKNTTKKATNDFSVDCEEGLPRVRGNVRRLEQVLINLIMNACEAVTDPRQAIRVTTHFDAETSQVVVTVSDEGRGIPETDLGRIMNPFYTTRREVGGTGLGLAVSSRIVEEHAGRLTFDSQVGRGTTVRLYLPASDGEPW